MKPVCVNVCPAVNLFVCVCFVLFCFPTMGIDSKQGPSGAMEDSSQAQHRGAHSIGDAMLAVGTMFASTVTQRCW